jgi:hypothetical protein
VIEDRLNVGVHTPAAREGLWGALRIDGNRLANFGEGRGQLILPQQKIAVTPGDFSGDRIDALGLQESFASGGEVALRFVGGGEIEPDAGVARLERQRSAVSIEGALDVGIFEVVLPIAAK